jgi:nucleolar protein 15
MAPGVIFLKHIPHGFYEDQMRAYFKQFGKVNVLRLSRSRKTGQSRGYAYVEFAEESVAKIAAEAMNNYLMFDKLLKCEYIPPEAVGPAWFAGCKREFTLSKRKEFLRNDWNNLKLSDERTKKFLTIQNKKLQQLKKKLLKLGVTLDIEVPPFEPSANQPPEKKKKKKKVKVEGSDGSRPEESSKVNGGESPLTNGVSGKVESTVEGQGDRKKERKLKKKKNKAGGEGVVKDELELSEETGKLVDVKIKVDSGDSDATNERLVGAKRKMKHDEVVRQDNVTKKSKIKKQKLEGEREEKIGATPIKGVKQGGVLEGTPVNKLKDSSSVQKKVRFSGERTVKVFRSTDALSPKKNKKNKNDKFASPALAAGKAVGSLAAKMASGKGTQLLFKMDSSDEEVDFKTPPGRIKVKKHKKMKKS